jgi:hydroxymethylglutaryl-CoA reductase (NADPH)
MTERIPVPRDPEDDYSARALKQRRDFVEQRTGVALEHLPCMSFDPALAAGNIENLVGVAQVPVGLAGPLRIAGEHAQGDFYIPLATTEGTLVASYSRGARVITESGGVRTTVVKTSMQRAPVFMFADALQARGFGQWLEASFDHVRQVAEGTTDHGRLVEIEQYNVGNLLYTRFNYTTGDAAGQNMTGKATHAACEWIRGAHPLHPEYMLSGATDTDKKHSAMNFIRTRGRRVIAEVVIPAEVLRRVMRVETSALLRARQIANAGAMQAGAAYNGPHAANGLAALFIATGQDAANVAECHAGITYAERRANGDYYWSVTLPSVIIGTRGGGTGLPTQQECLRILGCDGAGKADKLAEIAAAVVLAGDISLGCAVIAGDWVSSHERLGRNRPPS